ncbi:hypothetical protein [Flagellimonas marina]|uniref:Uncharacterized protein n=1 Tax=Flagellimonas marina TaxID=1775168 RepID=A0ABV8PJ07_9FLAO
MIKHDITIDKMSTEYFRTLSWALERYGAILNDLGARAPMSNEAKDHSICLEVYFKLEPKVSKRELSKPLADRERQNKSLKVPVHAGIVIIDALHQVNGERDFSQTPAMEHIKEQISKQLL